jgi:Cu-processing system permease protein
MRTVEIIIRLELKDLLHSTWLLAHLAFFTIVTSGVLAFGGAGASGLISLAHVVLILIPLASILFGTVYLYSARDFVELLLAQPVSRGHLFAGMFGGLAVPLSASYLVGTMTPLAAYGVLGGPQAGAAVALAASGVGLTLCFLALAMAISTAVEDRVRGLSIAVAFWLMFSLVYDGLLLLVIFQFAEYPIEEAVLGLSFLNPIDLSRILLLLEFDISALMGYTGAVFERFFGTDLGKMLAAAALLVWTALPLSIAYRLFRKRDF